MSRFYDVRDLAGNGNTRSGPVAIELVDYQSLVGLIRQHVAPSSWEEAGGSGSITSFEAIGGMLVVQTPSVHEDLADYLNSLRTKRAQPYPLDTLEGGATSSPAASTGGDGQLSLKDAVASFNAEAAKDPIGRSEPPLTEDEVVAALRAWDRTGTPVGDAVFAIFQRIADHRRLPEGAKLSFMTGLSNGKHEFTVWWVDLSVDRGNGTGSGCRIRDRKISCRPVSEP